MTKLVVFDVDGTFLDSFHMLGRVVADYSREQGLPQPCFDTIKMGYGDPHKYDFKWGVGPDEQLRHMIAAFRLADQLSRSGMREHTPPLFTGVAEGFEHLKDLGYTLGIVTSKSEEPLLHLLEHHGIAHYFSGIRNRNDVKRRGEREKPYPDMLQSLMRELKFAPEETAMVGDTTMDVRMGVLAGARSVGVTWGTHIKADLQDAGAHHIVDTGFADVAPVIRRLLE